MSEDTTLAVLMETTAQLRRELAVLAKSMLAGMVTANFVLDMLALQADYNCYGDPIWWRTDGEYAPVTFFILCNDLFVWACADTEEVTPDDVPDIRRAIEEVRAIIEPEKYRGYCVESYELGCELWVARKRGMRPQQPAYPKDERVRALFDACGPVRTPASEG